MSDEKSPAQLGNPHVDAALVWLEGRYDTDPIVRECCAKLGEANVVLLLARYTGTFGPALVRHIIRNLPEDQRSAASVYPDDVCRHCGTMGPDAKRCQCWNDE